MKKYILFLGSAFTAIASCTNAPDSDEAKVTETKEVATTAGEAFRVDTSASTVEWIGTKVTGYHSGEVPVKSGELNVKDNNLASGKFVLDISRMTVTGPEGSKPKDNDKLLGHLKTADFFDVEKHPEAQFEVTGVRAFSGTVADENDPRQTSLNKYKVGNPTHMINGNLTIKGVSKNIEFPARVTITGNTLEALAKFNIDRKQWDLNYPGAPNDLIRDQIHFGISLRATK